MSLKRTNIALIIGCGALLLGFLAIAAFFYLLHNASKPYHEVEMQMTWAYDFYSAIEEYHGSQKEWPASERDLPEIDFTGKAVEFLPKESPELSARITVNEVFSILIYKSDGPKMKAKDEDWIYRNLWAEVRRLLHW